MDVCVGIGADGDIAKIVEKALGGEKRNFFAEKAALDLNGDRILGSYPFSTYLKVGDGCDNCCTYCAIPKIRGRMRSRSIEDCVKEAQRLAMGGVKELTVVAQDTTAYGEDIYGKPMLAAPFAVSFAQGRGASLDKNALHLSRQDNRRAA